MEENNESNVTNREMTESVWTTGSSCVCLFLNQQCLGNWKEIRLDLCQTD